MKLYLLLVFLGIFCVPCESYYREDYDQSTKDFIDMVVSDEDHSDHDHDEHHEKNKGKKNAGHGWNYLFSGPAIWGHFKRTCNGRQQSPINIESRSLKEVEKQRITHNYGEKPTGSYEMLNNGHALQINFNGDTKYRLKKNGKSYTPLQVHIHFNPFTNKGSEHTFNQNKYFAEIHIVHKRTRYTGKSFMNHDDGLLVIGMFVDIGKNDSTAAKYFSNVAKECFKPDMKKKIKAFNLASLFPSGNANFQSKYAYVNYHGSLTTPPCSEIVDWIVVTGNTLKINSETAKLFKDVRNGANGPMGGDGGNNRPVQKLNKRTVTGVVNGFF